MMRKTLKVLLLMICFTLVIVGETAAEANDHGQRTVVGNLDLSGQTFEVALFGGVEANKEAAFEVITQESLTGLSTFLWVETKDGKRLSAPAKAIVEGDKLHFHVVPKEKPHKVVLRVRGKKSDERGSLKLPETTAVSHDEHGDHHGHGHGHSH